MPGALSAFKGQWPFQAQHHLAMPVFSAKMTRHHHRTCRILLYSSSSWEPCAPWPLQDGQLGFIHTILSLLQSGSCDKGHWSSAPAQTSSLASGVHMVLNSLTPARRTWDTQSHGSNNVCPPSVLAINRPWGLQERGLGQILQRFRMQHIPGIPHSFACLVIYAAAFAEIAAYFFFHDF